MRKTTTTLITILILGLLIATANRTSPPENPKPVITEAKYKEFQTFAEQMFQHKTDYLIVIQLDEVKGQKIVDELCKSGEVAGVLADNNYKELSEVYYNLYLAGSQLDMYLDTHGGKYFTKGGEYWDEAKRLYKQMGK